METPEAGEGVQVLNACGWSGSPEVRMALATGPRDRALITVSARTQLRKARGMVLLICMKNLSDFTQFPSGDPWIPWQGPLSLAALRLLGSHLHLGIRASKLIFFSGFMPCTGFNQWNKCHRNPPNFSRFVAVIFQGQSQQVFPWSWANSPDFPSLQSTVPCFSIKLHHGPWEYPSPTSA